jgi:hypothetical protein
MTKYEHVTTEIKVQVYESTRPIFQSLLKEIKELSKKKPEATMSTGKVKIINRVLIDLLTILKDEPTGKYLDALDDEALPQMSDAVLTMVQFESALSSFFGRYNQNRFGDRLWITESRVAAWNEEVEELEADDEE